MPSRIEYEDIIQPDLPLETIIWHYMDVPKFLDLLETRTLFFCRADKFEDKHEGALTEDEYVRQNKINEYFKRKGLINEGKLDYKKHFREKIFINCWHRNTYENVSMWKIYGGSSNSVAIISTVGCLTDALLEKCSNLPDLVIAEANYINYKKDEFNPIPVSSKSLTWAHVAPFFHKWKAYSFEQEIRAVFNTEVHIPLYPEIYNHPSEHGIKIPLDPDKLIKRIILSPDAPEWFLKLIQKIVLAHYGIKSEIIRSPLDSEPIFLE